MNNFNSREEMQASTATLIRKSVVRKTFVE